MPKPSGRRGQLLRAVAFTVALDLLELERHEPPRPLKSARLVEIADLFGLTVQQVRKQQRFGRALLHGLGAWPWCAAPEGRLEDDWRSLPAAWDALEAWLPTGLRCAHGHPAVTVHEPRPGSSAALPAPRRAA